MGTKEQRIQLLKEMNQYIIDLGDEEAYGAWFCFGVPDEPIEEDYESIAEDTEHWAFVCAMFGQILKRYENQRAEMPSF